MGLRIITNSYCSVPPVTLHKQVITDKFDTKEQICLCNPLLETELLLKSRAKSHLVAGADIHYQRQTRKNALFKVYILKYCYTYRKIIISVL